MVTLKYGVNPETALENIRVRKEEKTKNKKISKRRLKSALVVQGGCMRGIFSAGSLIALEKIGFCQGFDIIYASSSGAMNASYFLSEQGPFGTSIYYEDINNSKFINIFRVNKIVDIDYLFDKVLVYKKPLDTRKVINSETPFYFFATDIDNGNPIRFNSTSKNILELLKASCALPVYYNKPVFINGKGFLDGGICKAIPVEDAIKDSCTDILVLLTETNPKKSASFFEKFLFKKSLSKFSRKLLEAYLTCFENYKYEFDISIGRVKINNVNIVTILPDYNFRLTRLTKNESLLKEAAIDGAKKVFDLFNKEYDMNKILKYD